MKYTLQQLIGLFGILSVTSGYADGILSEPKTTSLWRGVIAAAGGVGITTNLGQSQTFPIQNPVTDEYYIYSPSNRAQTQGMFEVFLGGERPVSNWRVQGGLAYSQTGSYQSKGTFIQGADASSADQYTYQYNVVARALLVEAKLMRPYHDTFYPYFLVGLGGSFNKTSNFTTNVPPFLTFTREYAPHTSGSFVYKAGLGIDMNVTSHTRLGLSYRFADFGRANSGAATIDNVPVTGALSQSNLYANELLLQLTYLI